MESVRTNKEICENIKNIIDYEQYGEDPKTEDAETENIETENVETENVETDDYSKALENTFKNYLTFSAMLELNPGDLLGDEFESAVNKCIRNYFTKFESSDTPLYNEGIMTKAFYLGYFFKDLKKINMIREDKRINRKGRSRAKLIKAEVLYLAACDYYFNYFVGAYIAKLMLHLQVESVEEYKSARKFIEMSINEKNSELLEFVLYRIDNYDEEISISFDEQFGDQITDDAIVDVLVLDLIKGEFDINKIIANQAEKRKTDEPKKELTDHSVKNKPKKSSN